MQGLGAEIAKNLILSGIHSITLKDHTDVSILDRCSQFLIPLDSTERNVCIIFIEDNSYVYEANKILFPNFYIIQIQLSLKSITLSFAFWYDNIRVLALVEKKTN